MSLFQIRLYGPRKEASDFQVAATIDMDAEQASKVNVALCTAKADVRFWPVPDNQKGAK